jgi:hypothetical protein
MGEKTTMAASLFCYCFNEMFNILLFHEMFWKKFKKTFFELFHETFCKMDAKQTKHFAK